MVEGGGDLNERLQEAFLRLFETQPDAFPMLVSQEKLAPAVAGKPLRQRSATPVQSHAGPPLTMPSYGESVQSDFDCILPGRMVQNGLSLAGMSLSSIFHGGWRERSYLAP